MVPRYDNRHSRIVAWLKILLPLAALALLSSMFLLSRNTDPSQTIPFFELSVEDVAREERVGAPNYAGVTEDGAAIYITARAARPVAASGGAQVVADGVHATLYSTSGTGTALIAESGLIDTEAQMLRLSGGVVITTSEGLSLRTEVLNSRLDRTEIESGNGVTGHLHDGDLSAGKMLLIGEDGKSRALFTGGVKLIYRPQR
jgi:lipopolysaccharide export system protein LptC